MEALYPAYPGRQAGPPVVSLVSDTTGESVPVSQLAAYQSYYLIEAREWQIAQPLHYLIGNRARGWQIAQLLLVKIEQQADGKFITSESSLNVYGVGETVAQSVDDFTSMLVDLFEELVDSEDMLSHALRQQLRTLHAILAPY